MSVLLDVELVLPSLLLVDRFDSRLPLRFSLGNTLPEMDMTNKTSFPFNPLPYDFNLRSLLKTLWEMEKIV